MPNFLSEDTQRRSCGKRISVKISVFLDFRVPTTPRVLSIKTAYVELRVRILHEKIHRPFSHTIKRR